MLPFVISESLVKVFNFYQKGCVREGMSHGQYLYTLVESHTVAARLQAYTRGCELSNQGGQTIITVSDRHYKLWLELRSQATIKTTQDK
jgi:hypothetical protein